MLNIPSELFPSLPKIEVSLDKNDNPNGFVSRAGWKFPVVKVSNTVLASVDINAFAIDIGKSRLPTLLINFDDTDRTFMTSDYINQESKVTVFIGSTAASVQAIKLTFQINSIMSIAGAYRIIGTLALQNDIMTIPAMPFEDVLSMIAEKSKLGIKYNYKFNDKVNFNIVNMKAYDAINMAASYCKIDWYIDHYYNIVFQDIKTSIASHKQKEANENFFDGIKLANSVPVLYTNNNNKETQFGISEWNHNYSYADDNEYEYQAILYDKSFQFDIDKQQVAEGNPSKLFNRYDLVGIDIDTILTPHILAGETLDVEIWTKPLQPRRIQQSNWESGNKDTNTKAMLIQDYSGVFYVQSCSYTWSKGSDEISQASTLLKPE
jgi:hypothetical protein